MMVQADACTRYNACARLGARTSYNACARFGDKLTQYGILLWILFFSGQVCVLLWQMVLWELYNITFYLEKELKPLVVSLVEDSHVLMYEHYLSISEGKMSSRVVENIFICFVLIVLIPFSFFKIGCIYYPFV